MSSLGPPTAKLFSRQTLSRGRVNEIPPYHMPSLRLLGWGWTVAKQTTKLELPKAYFARFRRASSLGKVAMGFVAGSQRIHSWLVAPKRSPNGAM